MRSGGECSLPLTVPVCCRANRFSHDRKHFDWYLSYVSGKTSLLGSPRNHSSFPKVQTRDVGGKKAEWGNFSSQYLNYKVLRLFLIHVLSQGSPCSILVKTKRVQLLMYEFMSFILKLFLFFYFIVANDAICCTPIRSDQNTVVQLNEQLQYINQNFILEKVDWYL